MSMKYPPKPVGIEPATFRFVAQNLNHCATAVPLLAKRLLYNMPKPRGDVEISSSFYVLL